MSVTTPVIGPVTSRVAGPVTDPPGKGGKGGKGGGRSELEISISALEPIAWYRFRDPNFNQRIRDNVPGGNKHLLKQIAAATRSAVPTRTTHPGGALFPATDDDADWDVNGTMYQTAANLAALSGLVEFTVVLSMRLMSSPWDHTPFRVGTADDTFGGTNDLLAFRTRNPPDEDIDLIVRTDLGTVPNVHTANGTTKIVSDGVNRLYTVRFDAGSNVYRLKTSKPGHEYLTEEDNGGGISGNSLDDLSLPAILNARQTSTSTVGSPEMVVDQIALFDTDIGATAEADLHSKWMDEVAGAGYYPSMMQFDGSTGYYLAEFSATTANKVSGVLRFNRAAFGGDAAEGLARFDQDGGFQMWHVVAFSSGHTADANKADTLQVQVANSSGVIICRLFSPTGYFDGEDHVLFFAFDGDDGEATFIIDGIDADDTENASRVAPTTGTIAGTAATTNAVVGAASVGGALPFEGNLGFCGFRHGAYLTNYEDFMDGNLPKPIDEKDWTEFGSSQPLVFAHDGDLENNKGSAGDFTKNGTITRTVGGSP